MRYTYLLQLILSLIIIGFVYACSNSIDESERKYINFNFNDTIKIESNQTKSIKSRNTLKIAVSAISSPKETFAYYEEMFRYIEEEVGIKVEMVQRKTYEEINNLLKLNQVDMAFVCSGGYVFGIMDSAFQLLVVPERNGKQTYYTYIISHVASDVKKFEDLQGKKFAFTDPLSTSGSLYPLKRLKQLGTNENDFFSSFTYTHAHDNSIQLVAKRLVDGAAVNSLVFDYIATYTPEKTKNIRIIETSESYGMPPVVISNGVSDEIRQKLEKIFLSIHNDLGSKKILNRLMIDRYTIGSDTLYRSVKELVKHVEN
jgi:phosphonate transport system substrate-binding protein